jgi:hypothetical protein
MRGLDLRTIDNWGHPTRSQGLINPHVQHRPGNASVLIGNARLISNAEPLC